MIVVFVRIDIIINCDEDEDVTLSRVDMVPDISFLLSLSF